MSAVARAAIRGLVEWGGSATGILSIAANDADLSNGVIAVNDADVAAGVIAGGDWPATFAGAYDDVSSRIRRVTVRRGRDDLLATMRGGEATVDLADPAGTFNPANVAGPLYGEIEARLHPALLTWRFEGVEYPLFSGWVRHVSWEPQGRRGVAQLELVDLFYWLERDRPVIASTGPTTTGAAIGLILDAISWDDPLRRDLDDGDSILDFSADGSVSGLELIAELLRPELGVFYISAGGVAVYDSRHARASKPVSATIADRMTRVVGAVDFDRVRNRVTVERTQNGYVAEAIDAASRAPGAIGPADHPTIATPYLETDAQAENLADYLLSLLLDPRPPLRDLRIDHRDADLLEQIVRRELVDRLTIEEARGGTAGDYHVERLVIQAETRPRRRIQADYLLGRAATAGPLLIAEDDSDLDGGYIAANDADLDAGVLVY